LNFPTLASKTWPALAGYALTVLGLLISWQIAETKVADGNFAEIYLGLKHYATYRELWGGIFWNFFIVFCVLLEWSLLDLNFVRKTILREISSDFSITATFMRLFSWFHYLKWKWGLQLCALSFILVALFEPLSVVSAIYFLNFFVVAIFLDRSEILSKMWFLFVLSSAAILVARYGMQFPVFDQWVKTHYPWGKCNHCFILLYFFTIFLFFIFIDITISELGLVNEFQSILFVKLIGSTLIFLLVVQQAKNFFIKAETVALISWYFEIFNTF
jgi:hypothetical protein